MKHRPYLITLILIIFTLAACETQEDVAQLPRSVVPTGIHTPTETAVPISVVAETSVSTGRANVPGEDYLDNSTPLPTATPDKSEPFPLRPTSLPTVAFQTDVEYQLIQPPFESLLEVIRREAEFEDIHVSEYQGQSPYFSIYSMIETDIKSLYSGSLPVSALILNDTSLTSYYFGWYQPPEVLLYLLENGMLQYLNQPPKELINGLTIEREGFKLTPYSIELGDDLTPEWIVQFESVVFGARIFLLFDQAESGQDELINLGQITDTRYSDFEIADQDGDGLNDLQVTTDYFGRFGCSWEAVDLYRWPNQVAQLVLGNYERLDTAVCNLSAAITPFSFSWHPEKEAQYPLLERAVNQFQENPDAAPDLFAYALAQLAMAYLEQGLDAQARQAIDRIYKIIDESTYKQYIQEHDESDSVIDLCRSLITDEEPVLETDIGEYLTEAGFLGGRGMEPIPYKPAICDLKYIGLTQVQNSILPTAIPPAETLAELNLQYAFAQSANLDDDSDLEWIGILEPEAPWLVIFDAENGQWAAQYVVLLIDKVDQEYLIVDTNYLYDEQPDLKDIPDDFFNLDSAQPTNIQPSWKQLEGFLEEPEYIGFYIENLTNSILTQTDPDIPAKITELLNYLPPDDPDARPYIEHLTYLLGYHYELSGDEETAVSTYLSLIQQVPVSPWSWLAWARLEPVNP